VALSRVWQDWRSPLLFVKPATVIDWHRRGFRRYWRWKSGKPGRPRIPAEHIAFIRRISSEQPGWGEDRIAEELAIKLGVKHSTSTIRRYMMRQRKPRGGQTWKTFVKNHGSQIFAVDFLTQPTALFTVVYILVPRTCRATREFKRFSRSGILAAEGGNGSLASVVTYSRLPPAAGGIRPGLRVWRAQRGVR